MTLPRQGSPSQPVVSEHCAACGLPFNCGHAEGQSSCWCFALPRLPADALIVEQRCLCPPCLAERHGRLSG